MKFIPDYGYNALNKEVTFSFENHCFETIPHVYFHDVIFPFNQLYIASIGNIAMKIYGYSNSKDWVAIRIKPPPAKQGILLFQDGEALAKTSSDPCPIYCNPKNRWTCVGSPFFQGEAIEFMYGCIAVLDRNCILKSLWIRIDEPPLLFLPPSHNYLYQGKSNPIKLPSSLKVARLIWKWKGSLTNAEDLKE